MGQWGFGKNGDLAGTVCLFTGEPGTGKTLAAEAVGFETGKPLKVSHVFDFSTAGLRDIDIEFHLNSKSLSCSSELWCFLEWHW